MLYVSDFNDEQIYKRALRSNFVQDFPFEQVAAPLIEPSVNHEAYHLLELSWFGESHDD